MQSNKEQTSCMIGFPVRSSSKMPRIRGTLVFISRMYLDVSPQYDRSSFTDSSVKSNNDSVTCNAPSWQSNHIQSHTAGENAHTNTSNIRYRIMKNSLTVPIPVSPSINADKHELLASWLRLSMTGLLSFRPFRFSFENLLPNLCFFH